MRRAHPRGWHSRLRLPAACADGSARQGPAGRAARQRCRAARDARHRRHGHRRRAALAPRPALRRARRRRLRPLGRHRRVASWWTSGPRVAAGQLARHAWRAPTRRIALDQARDGYANAEQSGRAAAGAQDGGRGDPGGLGAGGVRVPRGRARAPEGPAGLRPHPDRRAVRRRGHRPGPRASAGWCGSGDTLFQVTALADAGRVRVPETSALGLDAGQPKPR